MTLIMSYQNGNHLLMVGDLLVSRPGSSNGQSISLPARFYPRFPVSNSDLSHLEQKIVLVNDQLSIAWSGNRIVAKSMISEIAKKAPRPYGGEDFLNIIENMDISESERKSVGMIIFGMNYDSKSVKANMFVQDYLVGETLFDRKDHKVKYSGSGTFHFLSSIAFDFRKHVGEISSYESDVVTFLSRMAIAFYQEIISNDNHDYYYGGGFEILGFGSDKPGFAKIPYASVFWKILDKGEPKLIGPIFSNQYVGTKLVINRIIFQRGEATIHRFVVANFLDSNPVLYDLPLPEFDPHFVIHYLIKDSGECFLIIKKGKHKLGRMTFDKTNHFTMENHSKLEAEIIEFMKPSG